MKTGDSVFTKFAGSCTKGTLGQYVESYDAWEVDVSDPDGREIESVFRSHGQICKTSTAKDLKAENERLRAALCKIGSGPLFFRPAGPMEPIDVLSREVLALRAFANKALEEETMKEFKEGDKVLAYDPVTQRWYKGTGCAKNWNNAERVTDLEPPTLGSPSVFLNEHIYPDSTEGYTGLIRFLHKEIEHLQEEVKRAGTGFVMAEAGEE